MTAGTFLRNRLIRIVPLYWLVSAGVLAMTFAAPQLLHTTVFSAPHAIASFLFLPARHPVVGNFWPLLIPGWTLDYEMLFYVLFAAAIAGSTNSRSRFLIVGSLITAVVLSGMVLRDQIDVMNFYANPILFEFLGGIMIGSLYMQRQVRSSYAWLVAIGVGFFLLWFGQRLDGFIPLTNLVAAVMIVAGALFTPQLSIPGLKALGDASYSLYLTHVVVLAALGHLWASGLRDLGFWSFVACALASCVIGALLCFLLVERPLTDIFKTVSRPARNPSPAVTRARH